MESMVTLSFWTVKPAMKSPPPPPKAATLHDVAREAGVSLITASRALSNPGVFGSLTGATNSARRIQLAARFTF